jgi:hypothetical protein
MVNGTQLNADYFYSNNISDQEFLPSCFGAILAPCNHTKSTCPDGTASKISKSNWLWIQRSHVEHCVTSYMSSEGSLLSHDVCTHAHTAFWSRNNATNICPDISHLYIPRALNLIHADFPKRWSVSLSSFPARQLKVHVAVTLCLTK